MYLTHPTSSDMYGVPLLYRVTELSELGQVTDIYIYARVPIKANAVSPSVP
jgi:hypothetical protein